MGKLRMFLISAAIDVLLFSGSVAEQGNAKIGTQAKEISVAKDAFARFRETEKHAFSMLVFLKIVRLRGL